MLKSKLALGILALVVLVGAAVALRAAVNGDDDEVVVPLSDVPAKVLEAANQATPGGEVTKVKIETEGGVVTYDVEKKVNGAEVEVEVTADGTVNKVEKGDNEDKDQEEENIEQEDDG